jgi:hypothetical protein
MFPGASFPLWLYLRALATTSLFVCGKRKEKHLLSVVHNHINWLGVVFIPSYTKRLFPLTRTAQLETIMKFDNSARMEQLQVILKSNKKSSSRHHDKTRQKGSDAGSSGRHDTSTIKTAALAQRSYNTTRPRTSSVCTNESSTSSTRSNDKKKTPTIKQIMNVQESWDKLKAAQQRGHEDNIGECIVLCLMRNTRARISRPQICIWATFVYETLDAMVCQMGPSLFEEKWDDYSITFIDKGLDAWQLSKVVLEGLRESNPRNEQDDIVTPDVEEAWQATIVALLATW